MEHGPTYGFGAELLINCTFEGEGENYSFLGTLQQTNAAANYSGNWYTEFDALPENIASIFSVIMN